MLGSRLWCISSEIVRTSFNQFRLQRNAVSHDLLKTHNDSNFTENSVVDHLAAGIDTTGDALTFLMYQLSLPESFDVQEKLSKEVQQADSRSLDDLPYLEAVVKEGLRVFPPIPMSQPRYVPAGGRTIDGYLIPAGTIVSCQAWSVHQLNEDVFPEGEKFIPERWLDAKRVVDMNRLFFAFGAGARGCTGRQ